MGKQVRWITLGVLGFLFLWALIASMIEKHPTSEYIFDNPDWWWQMGAFDRLLYHFGYLTLCIIILGIVFLIIKWWYFGNTKCEICKRQAETLYLLIISNWCVKEVCNDCMKRENEIRDDFKNSISLSYAVERIYYKAKQSLLGK